MPMATPHLGKPFEDGEEKTPYGTAKVCDRASVRAFPRRAASKEPHPRNFLHEHTVVYREVAALWDVHP